MNLHKTWPGPENARPSPLLNENAMHEEGHCGHKLLQIVHCLSGGQRERERARDRQTDRERDTQREREREKRCRWRWKRDGVGDGERERERERERNLCVPESWFGEELKCSRSDVFKHIHQGAEEANAYAKKKKCDQVAFSNSF